MKPKRNNSEKPSQNKGNKRVSKKATAEKKAADTPVLVRLNKYIADAGICSRREADKLIESGKITINNKVVTQLGTKVVPGDVVVYNNKTLRSEKLRYLLLNKPKGFITTSDDPQNRRTVMNLVEKACTERIYSVGRLDRNTTGLLLFTNDGELTTRLTHPKHGVKKLYHVVLDKPLSKNDMLRIIEGIELEDGLIRPDKINWVADEMDKRHVGIELHSGKNRIVRRIFEQLDYEVVKLDRVIFAGLTKKDLPRGKWRFLEEKEVNILKMI
ncbi:MAG: pseudouridine synthase [Bacteroidetes bacterium]|jgi:23S rRNA pseudouridine2605 synthase|nr:pseudouridine synthase [Bacteroidota bacterium]MAE08735.1 pseudouridine synthase [Bacteroidota bacterium]